MIHVLASITLKAGAKAQFIELFKANVPNVLAEEGCLEYQPAIDTPSDIDAQKNDPEVVTVIEKWESLNHLKAHLEAPHMLAFREKAADLISSVDLKILENA